MKRLLLTAILVLALPAAAAAPRSIKAVYDFYLSGARVAEVNETFSHDEQGYRIESVARAIGPIALIAGGPLTMTSKGMVTTDGLKPQLFSQRRGKNESKTLLADFRWEEGILTMTNGGKSERHDLRPNTLDRLSLLYQFLFSPPTPGETELFLATGKKLARYSYRTVGEERIKTRNGYVNTVHIAKIASGNESTYDIWLDKDRFYFPVKIIAGDEGKKIEQVLRSLTID